MKVSEHIAPSMSDCMACQGEGGEGERGEGEGGKERERSKGREVRGAVGQRQEECPGASTRLGTLPQPTHHLPLPVQTIALSNNRTRMII